MNLKKLFKSNEDGIEVSLTEGDEQLRQKLLQEVRANATKRQAEEKPRRYNNFWKVFSAVATACVAVVVVTVSVVFTRDNSFVYYKEENIETMSSNIDELQNSIKYFSFQTDSECEVKLKYDSISGDKLFYSLDSRGVGSEKAFQIVINEHYTLPYKELEKPQTSKLDNYNIVYQKNMYVMEELGIEGSNYRGYIKVQTETVYFDMKLLPSMQEEQFFDYIQTIVKVK